jgi:GTPase
MAEAIQQNSRTTADLRVAILGNVDSGKSTLVGVLSKYVLDDGRGLARSHVLQHKHEKEKGQTSAVALELIGFDGSGSAVLPTKVTGKHVKDFRDIATRSSRLITMIDLCGHEHFLKTTVFGLMGMQPDMVMLLVGANAGVQKMTREHLGLTAALQLPVIVVVTKIDMAPKHILEDSLKRVDRVLRLASRKKFSVNDAEEAKAAAAAMTSGNVAPVFQISCITGEGLDLLRLFYSEMACGAGESLAGRGIRTSTSLLGKESQPIEQAEALLKDGDLEAIECEMHVDNVYNVPGVGTVVSGSIFQGIVAVGMHLHLGPDDLGEFREVRVQSIHRQCVPVDRVFMGQQCTLAIKSTGGGKLHSAKDALKRQHIRKGMVMLSAKRVELIKQCNSSGSLAITTFEADVKVLHHTTTIQIGYAPIVHLGTIRQSAFIEKITFPNSAGADGGGATGAAASDASQNVLRTGSSALVQFRFAYRPEFVTPGRPLVFREGTTKGVGRVVRLL